jgi:hypothetical protein
MNRKILIVSVLITAAALAAVAAVQTSVPRDLAKIREATAQFHRPAAARAAGYGLVPGLDSCFENPGVGGMGFHYIDTVELNNTTLNLQRPEALVYTPSPNGLQLGAVEYIVPKALWDAAGNTQPPSLMGISLHLEPSLGVYILHAWVWKDNPAGTFEDWNPAVALCP